MSWLLRMLGGWRGYAAVAALSVALTTVVLGWRLDAQLARLQADHAELLERQAQAVVESVQAARKEEQRRVAAVEEQRDIAQRENDALAADVAAGRTVSERLRAELDALRARYAGRDTATTERGQGQPGTDPIGLLIELHAGLDEAGREVAEYADRLRIAGLACEVAWEKIKR